MKELWDRAKTICLAMVKSEDEKGKLSRNLSMVRNLVKRDHTYVFMTSSQFAIKQLQNDVEKLRSCLNLAGAGNDLLIDFEVDESTTLKIEPASISRPTENLSRTQVNQFTSTMPLNPPSSS